MVTRREALKTIGAAAVTVVAGTAGISAMASCNPETIKRMKILLLNGSPHPSGNTATLLAEASKQLAKNGIGSEIFQIGTAPVRGCTACGQCYSQRLGRCFFDDDVCNDLIAKMAECDAIIVGSPVYYGMPSGQVLSILQRMSYSASAVMDGKPAAAVTVCRRGGASAAFQTLQMPFQMLNMPIVTSQYWNIAYGSGGGDVTQDAEGLQTMRTLADNIAYMLKQFATGSTDKPSRERGVFTNFVR